MCHVHYFCRAPLDPGSRLLVPHMSRAAQLGDALLLSQIAVRREVGLDESELGHSASSARPLELDGTPRQDVCQGLVLE
jgi:hypothetical protein